MDFERDQKFTADDVFVFDDSWYTELTFGPDFTETAWNQKWFDENHNKRADGKYYTLRVQNNDRVVWMRVSDDDMLKLFAHYMDVRKQLEDFGVKFQKEDEE
jgi:hypothetical protein